MQQMTVGKGCRASKWPSHAADAGVQLVRTAIGCCFCSSSSSSRCRSRSHLLLHELISEVGTGDSSRVQQLLDSAKADMTEGQLAEALCCAAAHGRTEVVTALLAAGVPVDASGAGSSSYWHYMVLEEDEDPDTRPYYGPTPLYCAAEQGQLLVVRELLAAGADCNARCSYSRTPLHAASSRGHLSVVKALLAAGADVDAATDYDRETALHAAACCGYASIVHELLAAGADPAAADRNGYIALNRAATRGHVEVVEELVAGAAVCSKQQWIGAATEAIRYGHTGVIGALLAAPAEVQERSCLVVLAVECGPTSMVEHLLGIGLESSQTGPERKSAFARAVLGGRVDALVLLLRASKQQAPPLAQVRCAAYAAAYYHRSLHHVLAQLLLHLHKSGCDRASKCLSDTVSASLDQPAARLALLQGWAANAAQQQQQHCALIALEQGMAESRPVVMGLLFAVQHPAARVAAAQQAALPQRWSSTY